MENRDEELFKRYIKKYIKKINPKTEKDLCKIAFELNCIMNYVISINIIQKRSDKVFRKDKKQRIDGE